MATTSTSTTTTTNAAGGVRQKLSLYLRWEHFKEARFYCPCTMQAQLLHLHLQLRAFYLDISADVVLWPAYGLSNVPRVEDFGTMPVGECVYLCTSSSSPSPAEAAVSADAAAAAATGASPVAAVVR